MVYTSSPANTRPIAVCILAAGKGKRMGDPERAKVLTPLHQRPLLEYVLDTAAALNPAITVAVIGHQRQAVSEFLSAKAPYVHIAVQEEQLGTGHAVQQARTVLEGADYDVIILSGDVPLLSTRTLQALVEHHRSTDAAVTILTTHVADPTGYGRIVRDGEGAVARIVEHKDATHEERSITEINSGIYLVQQAELFRALDQVRNANAQNEYYLTDIAGIIKAEGKHVEAMITDDPNEVHGINTPTDLQKASTIIAQRQAA